MKGRSKGSRKDRLIQERVHDTYKSRRKLPEPTICPQCRAVYHQGRWQWAPPPAGAAEHTCPACQRSNDGYPAGTILLSGEFLHQHREEILNAARNVEERAKAERPLERIMKIEDDGAVLTIATTDSHLARAIGDALYRAYEGDLQVQYASESDTVRVTWTR